MTLSRHSNAHPLLLAAALAISLGLSIPAVACNLDGIVGPSHGGFGGWGQLMANRHRAQSPLSGGNLDSGDTAAYGRHTAAPSSDSDENQTDESQASEPAFVTLPGPAAEVRESGGSVRVEERREEVPFDLSNL